MLLPIFFGALASAIIFFVLRALFEEYNHTNIFLYYVYAIVFLILSVVVFIFRYRFSKMFYNITFWNTILISTFVIAILIVVYVLSKRTPASKSKS